ncbi:MAG: GTP-binding protein, partial [Cyanobacteria bacterium P01_H01_bin.121]
TPRRPVKLPQDKTDVADATLQAVEKQVAQIQDEVARRSLLQRSRAIAASFDRGEIRIAVFGTGSAGKTSLINALLGEVVGAVGAPMGTTDTGATYPLRLEGLKRTILITDTPGILETGDAGSERARLARQLAVDADLLLFVVDDDMRRSELEPLRTLAAIGKRSLLVFNKVDLFAGSDQDAILARLRERVRDLIAPLDVIAVAARPSSVRLPDGTNYQPNPDISPLIERITAVLRADGEDLVADNILLQSQRLSEQARQIIDTQRRQQAEKVVERFQWIGAGVIMVTPLPVVDLLGTAAVNTQMVIEIGRIYGCDLNLDRGRDLALSLAKTLTSLGLIKGSLQLFNTLQLNMATIAVGRAIQGVSAAYLTRIAGRSFIEYFRHDQDWGDGGITEVVQRQFQLNRKEEFIKSFVQDAIAKVVQPLTNALEEPESEPELIQGLEREPILLEQWSEPKPSSDWFEPVSDDW